MRILTLTNCPLDPLLGSGRTVLRFSNGLRALGHTVDVAAPSEYQWWHAVRRGKRFTQAFGAAAFVRARLRHTHYDLIELYGAEYWLVTALLSRQARRPLIVAHTNGLELLHMDRERARRESHGSPAAVRERASAAVHYALMQSFFRDADGFVALCDADRRYVVDRGLFPPARTAVIDPGLDPEFLGSVPPLDQRRRRICFTGSWTPRKGVLTLQAVIPAVLRARPDVHFDVLGTGAEPAAILAALPGDIRARVTVHPRLSNAALATVLADGMIFFLPTEYEGYGMATAEAMARGLAVVTTPTGVGSSLHDGTDALICEFGDVDAMIRSLVSLLDNADLRLRIAGNGLRRTQQLQWPTRAQALAHVYQTWLSEDWNSMRRSGRAGIPA